MLVAISGEKLKAQRMISPKRIRLERGIATRFVSRKKTGNCPK
jgi:hypothetical protein